MRVSSAQLPDTQYQENISQQYRENFSFSISTTSDACSGGCCSGFECFKVNPQLADISAGGTHGVGAAGGLLGAGLDQVGVVGAALAPTSYGQGATHSKS